MTRRTPEERKTRRLATMKLVRVAVRVVGACTPALMRAIADGKLTVDEVAELTAVFVDALADAVENGDGAG